MKTSPRGGQKLLVASVGSPRFDADWNNPRHRSRRIIAEFTGVFGLVFGLSGTAAVLNTFEGATPPKYFVVLVLSGLGQRGSSARSSLSVTFLRTSIPRSRSPSHSEATSHGR